MCFVSSVLVSRRTLFFVFHSDPDDTSEGDNDEAENCEHVEIVLSAFWSEPGITQLGVRLKSLLHQASFT